MTKAEREGEILARVGKAIRRERKRRKWSQIALADRAGCCVRTVMNIELGRSTGTAFIAPLLVELGLTLEVKEVAE